MWILHRTIVIALLALATTPVGAADSIGRLFMTPEQRAALDSARESGNDMLTDASQRAQPRAVSPDQPILLNGVVRRSRGPNVAWVNGARMPQVGTSDQGVQLRRGPDRHNQVTLGEATGTTARLKPGQFWIPASGQVADCYGCAAVSKPADLIETLPSTTTGRAAATEPTTPLAAPAVAAPPVTPPVTPP